MTAPPAPPGRPTAAGAELSPTTRIAPTSDVAGGAQRWAHAHFVPLNASIETTLACNIRCIHCYNFDRDEPRHAAGAKPHDCADGASELSAAEISSVMGELRDAGCLFLSLTGGEVLAHPDLFALLDRARELNLAVQLLTNGTLLRPGMAKQLAGYRNLLGVSVSVYGATAAVHDGVTQVKGSFARTWAGVERLRACGVAVRIKLIVMRQNAHETAAMLAAAAARGLPCMVDMTITARHDGSAGSIAAARVDRSQLESLCAGPLRALLPRARDVTRAAFNCNCARGNCAISARGDVYPCISVPWTAGNIRQQRFIDIWRDSPVFRRIRGLTLQDYRLCAPCGHRAYCSRDRGAAFTATGDYTSADPFVCATAEVAHRLAEKD